MAKARAVETDLDEATSQEAASIEEGKIIDYITEKTVKDTPKERVRQRIARAILQAAKDMDELKGFMGATEACEWGLWTNGLELFFLKKKRSRFDIEFEPMGDWPLADESLGTKDVHSHAKLRRADRELLLITFRRCHNFIHGNEGMSKAVAFWQHPRRWPVGHAVAAAETADPGR